MKRLFALVAAVGLGACLAGCDSADKPATAPSKAPPAMHGAAPQTGPRGNEAGKTDDAAKDEEMKKDDGDAGAADEKKDEAAPEEKEGE